MATNKILAPQQGPQTQFLSSTADIVVYGGAAGGGKSFALLLEPLRHKDNNRFAGVIFRRTSPQLMNAGGLWDEAGKMYPETGGEEKKSDTEYVWDDGMRISFRHMEHEKNKLDWQGSQVPYIGFDEVTHFSESQFVYMMSRNRSDSGVPGYIRATCNPDPDSWVRTWIDWWIKGTEYPKDEQGLPIPERIAVVRWFIRQNDEMIWADEKQELIDKYQVTPVTDENQVMPKSFTFIPATVYDNKILLRNDPSYLANLKAMPRVEREALLGGNWDVRAQAGSYYNREWIHRVERVHHASVSVRFWDRAASEPSEAYPDPDWTVGLRMFRQPQSCHPRYVIAHVDRDRKLPAGVRQMIANKATVDGFGTRIILEQEPGSSGKSDAMSIVTAMAAAGYEARKRRPTGKKKDRYMPFSSECENGNMGMLPGAWNDAFHRENENCVFDGNTKDDQCDAASGAFNELSENHIPNFEIPSDFGLQVNQFENIGQ